MEGCPICERSDNIDITNEILKGIMTIAEGMDYFGVSREVMEEHLKEHIRVLPDGEGRLVAVKREVIDSIGLLQELIMKLKDLFDQYSGDPDITSVRALTTLVRELRGCIRIMEELTGKLQVAPVVKLHLQQIVINKLQTYILEQMCPECQQKAIQYLGKELELQQML